MDPQFWHDRWQRSETGWHQPEFNAHLQECWPRLALPAASRVFVPLCGKSRDLLWLRAAGHEVLGVELSPIAVRDFFAENGLAAQQRRSGDFDRWDCDGLTLLCGDFFALTPERLAGVAGVYDRASLIALPPPMRERYARQLVGLVPAASEILLVTMEYDQREMNGPPFAVHDDEVRRLYEPGRRVTRLYDQDILAENSRLQERGLRALREVVYRLSPPG